MLQGHPGSDPPAVGNHAPHCIKAGKARECDCMREREKWKKENGLIYNLKN